MINRIFIEHPQSVDETYFEHARFAATFSFWLFLAAGAALIHAFIPAAFEKTASRIIARLYAKTHNRGQ
ncbi:DUF6356 family protein [Aliiroseovarius sp. S253]|uniref:DUF6356 family protein n=1 Tax=Aliiroseovarius sp. S253 TaxID=3415133 RepID=UPI003C799229